MQVDLVQSLAASPTCTTNGRYYCHFLGCHPDDASLPDPGHRWWLLWHRFTCSHDNVIEYGTCSLFNPITTPDPAILLGLMSCLYLTPKSASLDLYPSPTHPPICPTVPPPTTKCSRLTFGLPSSLSASPVGSFPPSLPTRPLYALVGLAPRNQRPVSTNLSQYSFFR